ncbi:CHAT domain-containing protein [Hyalangium gracile]|uniref:CHAT domain-containing protein n=1 Tax=Hyalangium gracile TaxID=394092 RepID=UPI001CCEF04F|nr:CHAT domain-containing protein [Hyalangium gracile]
MSAPCENLSRFADGELSPEEAASFQEHLLSCERCQVGLSNAVQMELRADRLLGTPKEAEVVPLSRPRPASGWRRASPFMIGGGLALAASLVAVVYVSRPRSVPAEVWLAQAPTRGLEARLSDARADRHRPYDVPRSGGSAGASPSLADLAALERQQDFQGIAAAWLVRGDGKRAAEFLARMPAGPDVDSDMAAIALAEGRAEDALALADRALQNQPGHTQAQWNRGLALRELGLELQAAEAFEQVAARKEPGWAQEATRLASALREQVRIRKESWEGVLQAGRKMVADGTPLTPRHISEVPGLSRLYLYDAVRAAPTAERVMGLLGVAEQLDKIDSGTHLVAYVSSVARRDFTRRRPLAETYGQLALGTLPVSERAGFLDRLRQSQEQDILLGALLFSPTLLASVDEYRKLALATGDPWFELLAEEQGAAAEMARGEYARAEARLLSASQRCQGTFRFDFRCAQVEQRLSTVYDILHRLQDARRHGLAALQLNVRGRAWGKELAMLQLLGQIAAHMEDRLALTHGYLEESLARVQPAKCFEQEPVYSLLAMAHQKLLDFDGARKQVDKLAGCTQPPPSLARAFAVADLARLRPQPKDEEILRLALEATRAENPLGPGKAALAMHIEGRFELERSRTLGQSLLRRSLALAEPLPHTDTDGRKARAYSYTSLLFDAGKHGEYDEALALFANEQQLPTPSRCALGLTVEDERTLIVARDAQGRTSGHYDVSRKQPFSTVKGLVPEPMVTALSACESVDVLARPPIQGQPGLLPAKLAWAYRVGPGSPAAPPRPERRLIVSDIEIPTELRRNLPRLEVPLEVGTSSNTELLRGSAATPARVREAMASATEIAIHTHGLIDLGVSDGSFLVLSKGDDGGFTLTARDLQDVRLAGHPVVLLAACYSAQTAPYQHESFGLPAAFIQAGARSVLATTEQIPNREANAFFDQVLARIRAGETPAVVLRDERLAWLERQGTSWVEYVLLFQ